MEVALGTQDYTLNRKERSLSRKVRSSFRECVTRLALCGLVRDPACQPDTFL